jgi:hypothetical protein
MAFLAAITLCTALTAFALSAQMIEAAGAKSVAATEPVEDASITHLKEGFRGVAWGTKKGDMKALGIYDCKQMDAIIENCAAEKGVKKLETVPLTLLRYKFADEAFFGLTMKFDAKQADMAKGFIVRELGQPSEVQQGVAYWKGDEFTAWMSNTHFVVNAKKPVEDAITKNKKK